MAAAIIPAVVAAANIAIQLAGTTTDTKGESNSNTTGKSKAVTDTTQTSALMVDPDALAMLRHIAKTAISNSEDPAMSQKLIGGILQNAGDMMGSVFGKQRQAGIYDSSSAAALNNDTMARATNDAIQAIFGYRTGQQQIAQTASQSIASDTAVQTTKAESVATQDVAQTTQAANYSTDHKGPSVICTWLMKTKRMSLHTYLDGSFHFHRKPWYIRAGYTDIAQPLVAMMKKSPDGMLTKFISSIFIARAIQLSAHMGYTEYKKSFYGAIAVAIVAVAITPTSLFRYAQHILYSGKKVTSNV